MKRWTYKQKKYVFENFSQKSVEEIARDIGKTTLALKLFIHRNRNDPRLTYGNNLLLQLLRKKFRDLTCFTPSRTFFDTVKIGQKRYWSIYKGHDVITEQELKRLAEYFEITLDGVFDARQTNLF